MWQEPLIWLPLLLLLLWLADWLLPQIDPDAGIDGPGFLYGLVQAMIAFAVAGFVAWIAQRTYGVSLSEEREEEVLGECRKGKVGSMFVIALPWIQWFLVFYLMWDKMA